MWHALEGRTGPFQVKTAMIFARLFELFERVRDVAQVDSVS